MQFRPLNKPLWHFVLEQTGESPKKRIKAVASYRKYGGRFTGVVPKFQIPKDKQVVADTLLEHSVSHNWRQYIGNRPFVANSVDIALNLPAQFILQPQSYFGISADMISYQVLIPDIYNSMIRVPRKVGYALMTLSRELSIREAKFATPPNNYPRTVFLEKTERN